LRKGKPRYKHKVKENGGVKLPARYTACDVDLGYDADIPGLVRGLVGTILVFAGLYGEVDAKADKDGYHYL
jgi:hypothetical protein